MQITVNIQDDFEDALNQMQIGSDKAFMDKAFNVFLFQLKNTGKLKNLDKAYEALLNIKPSDYDYSDQDLAGIDEGIMQAEQGLHVSESDVDAFFDDWKNKFKAV